MTAPAANEAAQLARYGNALTGLAAGDAWGYQVEFRSYATMPAYPVPAPAGEWIISDDTQMTLALHDALTEPVDFADITAVTDAIVRHFVLWQVDPDNNRAPGRACMGSLHRLRAGARWYDKDGARESAGCGAVMRLVPAAFAPEPYWRGLTALQAVITHKHPRAIVPALLLADAIRHAPERGGRFLEHALAEADRIYDGVSDWLTDPYLADVLAPYRGDVSSVLVDGLNDDVVDILIAAADTRDRFDEDELDPSQFGDPCAGIGEGWESASAIALGLLAADLATSQGGTDTAPLTGPEALAWAATSNGDSDSIACIAGAIIGAAHTVPDYWHLSGLMPQFEPRYAAAIATAAGELPGVPPAE
ncbi:ADP-ribosylglycohydrolase family protein [Prescottella agglutinans]|jgi:ADP-ribosylglycohydrolase|uniref:ADP-ribosylglycohydrolase n=1 Tax=Prescottella agglutinans TaxID=1644129 RepID=A0ABT6ML54_9NOCA|nr:ADP-ribosylglycohydrolase family protein [Prescottella agglutinans]MDH6285037.1 ADP-ribosylglycohydrolase [Prescottella agglutinans]